MRFTLSGIFHIANLITSRSDALVWNPVGSISDLHFPSLHSLTCYNYSPLQRHTTVTIFANVGVIRFVSSTDATKATRFLTVPSVALSPTEHICFFWTHSCANTQPMESCGLAVVELSTPPRRSRHRTRPRRTNVVLGAMNSTID